ncbi:MAG: hypothetical protein LQ338_001671 [Usnochroma carphineum]|nr:MAG: hypothetical protein LQ338_001671 [Usnochroma carphineum]
MPARAIEHACYPGMHKRIWVQPKISLPRPERSHGMLEKRTALADAVAEVAEAVLPAASPVDMPNEEPQKEYANLVRAQISTSASTAKTGRPPGANVENFKLVQPSQFMSHVRTVTKSAAPKVNVASSSIPTPATQSASAPKPGVVPKVTAQPVSKPNTADLLDAGTDRTIATTGSEHQTSYANDLLDISIDESNSLPPPMELSTKVNVEEIHPAVSKAVSREVASGAASMMAYLESKLAPELFKQVKLGLQKKGPLQPLNKQNQAAPPSLADAIQQRKQEWSQQVIGDTVTAKGSIFGEHVVRSRWAERQNSTASAASSTGLVKGINELHLDESQPSVASQSVGPAEVRPQHSIQYATTNPFGPKTTIGGPTLAGHTHARQNDNDEPAPSAAKPQVPDYIQTGSVPAGEFSKGTLSNTVKTFTVTSPQATSRARDYIVPSSQGPILWRDHATGGTKDDGQRLQGDAQPAKDPGAAARAQYSQASTQQAFTQPAFAGAQSTKSSTTGGPSRVSTRPRPPPYLDEAQPAKDPGAAARQHYGQDQHYGLREQAAPINTQFASPPKAPERALAQSAHKGNKITDYFGSPTMHSSSKTGEDSHMTRFKSGSNEPHFSKMDKSPPKPTSWIAELATAADPGAAARRQYGMKENSKP